MIDSLDVAIKIIDLFSMVITVIALILSFFVLLISFTANVTENAWEFGVLRAIGLNKSQMTRIYIYESMSLMLSAGILGIIVGVLTSTIMLYQSSEISELPFRIEFAPSLIAFTCVLSIMIAVLAPFYATSNLKQKQIANIIKGL
eukprot:TRINITY_DN7418_c0_g2_i2.p1 TRINITY_DN7418_c0_g2~~TRINITY_DN7418_c0_g2_i2.p1  ORF type:complete len:145 (-),score=1.94 TRINITY_DN7418_c0_g2_i2:94-528(-)